MGVRDTAVLAVRGLARHPLRASLNTLGILAGVASLLLLVSVTRGAGPAAKAAVQGLGADIVVVYPGSASSSGVQAGLSTTGAISSVDLNVLNQPGYVPNAVQAVPTDGVRSGVVALARSWQTDVIGSTPGFASAREYSMSDGRFIDTADVDAAASVVVLGQTVVDSVFPDRNAVGRIVQINDHPFRVVGVFASRGYSGTFNQDDLVVMPITTAWTYVVPGSAPRIQQVLVQATSPSTTTSVQTEVTNTLLQQHHITNPANADFHVETQHDLLASSERVASVMRWMLGVVAAVALITGAIGITSLMLASVTERTYEIGVRRAVGAQRRDILVQFMVEAVLLALVGGVAGIALGLGGTAFVTNLLSDISAPVVSITAIVLAGGVALVVGIVAGLYPALRASRLQPVEAVRRF